MSATTVCCSRPIDMHFSTVGKVVVARVWFRSYRKLSLLTSKRARQLASWNFLSMLFWLYIEFRIRKRKPVCINCWVCVKGQNVWFMKTKIREERRSYVYEGFFFFSFFFLFFWRLWRVEAQLIVCVYIYIYHTKTIDVVQCCTNQNLIERTTTIYSSFNIHTITTKNEAWSYILELCLTKTQLQSCVWAAFYTNAAPPLAVWAAFLSNAAPLAPKPRLCIALLKPRFKKHGFGIYWKTKKKKI